MPKKKSNKKEIKNRFTIGLNDGTIVSDESKNEDLQMSMDGEFLRNLMTQRGWEVLDLQLAIRAKTGKTPTPQTVDAWLLGTNIPATPYMLAIEDIFSIPARNFMKNLKENKS